MLSRPDSQPAASLGKQPHHRQQPGVRPSRGSDVPNWGQRHIGPGTPAKSKMPLYHMHLAARQQKAYGFCHPKLWKSTRAKETALAVHMRESCTKSIVRIQPFVSFPPKFRTRNRNLRETVELVASIYVSGSTACQPVLAFCRCSHSLHSALFPSFHGFVGTSATASTPASLLSRLWCGCRGLLLAHTIYDSVQKGLPRIKTNAEQLRTGSAELRS